MAIEFPVPRAQVPRVDVTPHECEARKLQMERALLATLDEYERFRGAEQGRIDVSRWKLVDSQDMLRLFRERGVGESLGHGHAAVSSTVSSFSASDDSSASQSSHDFWEDETASGHDDRHRALRMVGDLPGRVENAVYAFITRIMRELALVQTFLHDDVADCALLSELEGPTKEAPLQSLTYKWVVKKTPGKADKFRDLVFLESVGVTTTPSGDKIGYVLIESVELPSFPKLADSNCTRTSQSVRILLRQKTDELIDVYATGVAEPAGSKKARPMAAQLAAQTLFTVTKAMELAECMRLTKMLARQRPARDEYIKSRKRRPSTCSLCHTKSKFYNDVSLMDCIVCGHAVCTRCYTVKRVFIADGILGRFYRVDCCDTCLLLVDRSRLTAQTPMKTNVSAQLQRLNSSRNFDAKENYSFSRPRSSSDSSIGDPTDPSKKQGLEPTFEEEEVAPESSAYARRGGPADWASINRQHARQVPQPSRHTTRSAAPVATANQASALRLQNSSIAGRRVQTTQRQAPQPQPLRRQPQTVAPSPTPAPTPPPAVFTSSATAITYDLTGHTGDGYGALPSMPQAPRSGGGSSQQDLLARMMELQRLAESTYQTTKQNERFMQQQQRAAARHGSFA